MLCRVPDAPYAPLPEPSTSLLRMHVITNASAGGLVDVELLHPDSLIGQRIGVFVSASVGGVRWGLVTGIEACASSPGAVSLHVMFDDGLKDVMISSSQSPHSYVLPGIESRTDATRAAQVCASLSGKVLHCSGSTAAAARLEVGSFVQVSWPLRGCTVRGVVAAVPAADVLVVHFEDGIRTM